MAHFPSLVQPPATATYQGGGVLPGPGDLTRNRARARARRAGCDAHEKNVVYRATMFCSLRTSGHWPRIPAAATLRKAAAPATSTACGATSVYPRALPCRRAGCRLQIGAARWCSAISATARICVGLWLQQGQQSLLEEEIEAQHSR